MDVVYTSNTHHFMSDLHRDDDLAKGSIRFEKSSVCEGSKPIVFILCRRNVNDDYFSQKNQYVTVLWSIRFVLV